MSSSSQPSGLQSLSKKFSLSSLSLRSSSSRHGATTPSRENNINRQASTYPSAPSMTHLASISHSVKGGDGNTIAQLYAVFGLPKDPAVWTLAEEDCVSGVHHVDGAVGRFWRPEVLGCSICPPPAEILGDRTTPKPSRSLSRSSSCKQDGSKSDGADHHHKKGSNPKFIEMADGRGGVERAETARVLSKALKLSFTREIEVTSGQTNYPPPSSSHTFSFSVPTIKSSLPSLPHGSAEKRIGSNALGVTAAGAHKHNAANAVGEGYGLDSAGHQLPPGQESSGIATFYGVVLTVWSAADERRAKAVQKELSKAVKARSASRNRKSAHVDMDEIEPMESDSHSKGFSFIAENNSFFMPYAICIISRYPVYNLLGDWNKAAWFKYSRNIEMHNKLMAAVLRHPAPRLGDTFRLDSPDEDLSFTCTFPGAVDWGRGLLGIDFMLWPLFKTLSVDNILTICEVALSPCGRVLFLSRHPALLGMAVETIKYLVELGGWKGVAHQNCHARDVRIYLEDPGSWLIAINTELRSIVKPPREVCVVDLDINFVNCPKLPLKGTSSKGLREKKHKKLINALGFSSAEYGPPREFADAFPAGRFRPLSRIETRSSRQLMYERLDPPSWWDQATVLAAFDQVLNEGTKSHFFKRVLKIKSARQPTSGESENAAILALRRRASTFVDARDGLENKIGRLNKRLAFLMSEGDMWRQQFEKIQQLVDRLTREANDLRSKVDKERRESRRLSSTLQQRDMEQVQIQLQLRETEQAREKAEAELVRMREAMDTLEQERESMMDEIRNVLSTGEDFNLASLSIFETMAGASSRRSSRSNSPVSIASHNTEQSILKSRAMAEQIISMGRTRTRTNSVLKHKASSTRSPQLGGREREQQAEQQQQEQSPNIPNQYSDEHINYEIQSRTSAVTDQISRIQQQLEATLTQLEGRRSGTYERVARRRMSSSSINSYRYEHFGPPSSIGHGFEPSENHDYEAVERVQDNTNSFKSVDSRSPNLTRSSSRRSMAPPSAFRAPSISRKPSYSLPSRTAKNANRSRNASVSNGSPDATVVNSSFSLNTSPSLLSTDVAYDADGEKVRLERTDSQNTLAKREEAYDTRVKSGSEVKIVEIFPSSQPDQRILKDVVHIMSPPKVKDSDGEAAVNHASHHTESTSPANSLTRPATSPIHSQYDSAAEVEDEEVGFDMFQEPEGFRAKTPPPSVTYYQLPGTGAKVTLNLVGSHPLWGHLAWNASYVMADFLTEHATTLTRGKRVLELGAAAGLPSIVCQWNDAAHVVATDYPDRDLVRNLEKNIELNCGPDSKAELKGKGRASVQGFVWGSDPSSILAHLPEDAPQKFDLILMSDLIFNHQAHPALLETCEVCLAEPSKDRNEGVDHSGIVTTPCVLVFFTHHRPHLAYKDMQFFDMAEVKGWKFEKLGEWHREPMFPGDPGDGQVRSTVHAYKLWKSTA